MIGSTNTNVFPLPVKAIPIKSRPYNLNHIEDKISVL